MCGFSAEGARGWSICSFELLNSKPIATSTAAFFWQIPSGVFQGEERVPEAFDRALSAYGIRAHGIWAAEHAYTIYNRRFHEIQIISVYAAEVSGSDPQLNAAEHDASGWFQYEAALAAVHYRGLKDGLRSVREYVTGPTAPAPELCLRAERPAT